MSLEGRPAEIGARYAREIITRSRTRRADAHRRVDALARFTAERSTRPRAAHARAQQRASHATATTQSAPAAHARHAPNGVTPTNAPPERARAASTRGAELRYRA